jgi:polar amino acid transport system substrate-binding protein
MRGAPALALTLLAAAPAAAEVLRIGVTPDYPPYLERDGTGGYHGLDAELLAEICARGGWDCRFADYTLADLLAALRAGEVDVIAGGIGISAEREAFMDFTCPYYIADTFEGTFLGLDAGLDPAAGPVAVAGQSLYDRAMRQAGHDVRAYPGEAEALAAVLAGEVPVFFGSSQVAGEGSERLAILGSHPIATAGPALGVGEEAEALRDRLDAVLADLSAEGRLAALQRAWLSVDQGDVIADCMAAVPQA